MTANTTFLVAPAATRPSRRILHYLPAVPRFLLGALFFVSGVQGFLTVIPPPSGCAATGAMAFGGALLQTGYMCPLISGTELLAGALLLSNRFVPLALTILAPVAVNIFAFHAFLAPSGLGMAALIVLAELSLAWSHRAAFAPMLRKRALLQQA